MWSESSANKCVVTFGGVTHFDAAEFQRSERMVAEARVKRASALPKRVNVMESVRVPWAMEPTGFICHDVRLVVLSSEPVSEDEDGKGKIKKETTAMAPDGQVGGSSGEDGTEERPESVNCYL